MKNSIQLIICSLLLAATHSYGQTAEFQNADIIFAGGDDKVLMIDASKSSDDHLEVIWEWKASETKDLPEEYFPLLATIDESKPLEGGEQLLLTSSSGATLLLERESKKALFYAKTPNAHSAAMLPNNRIVVALSTHDKGNSIELYDKIQPEKVLFKDELYSGHGVVWIEEQERLFALGYDELRAYSLEDWDTEKPTLVLTDSWKIRGVSGHDLIAVSDNLLLISTHEGVSEFNIKEQSWKPFEPLATVEDVKSMNWNPQTEELIYTKAEVSWWTHNIYLDDKTLKVPNVKIYKVRPLTN